MNSEISLHRTQRKQVYSNGVNLCWDMHCGRERVTGIQLQCEPATSSVAVIVQTNIVTRIAQ